MAHYRKLNIDGQIFHWVIATDDHGFNGAYIRELTHVIPGYELEEMTLDQYIDEFAGEAYWCDDRTLSALVTPSKVANAIKRVIG